MSAAGRPFAWRDHWLKLVVAAPVLAAFVSLSVSEAQSRVFGSGPGRLYERVTLVVILANAALALAGSLFGGLMVRGTSVRRAVAGGVSGAFGGFVYIALGETLPYVVGWATP
jgi:hypothetical protein